MSQDPQPASSPKSIRWWPGVLIALLTLGALIYLRLGETADYQLLFMKSVLVTVVGGFLLWLWLVLASRLPGRTRLKIFAATVALFLVGAGLFRIRGVSGNLVPILEFRWAGEGAYEEVRGAATTATSPYDFPQFRGPNRDGEVQGVTLARDWQAEPPKELWRRSVGEAWSGFAVVGDAALTLEQVGDKEVVSRYDLTTGEPVWTHGIDAKYDSVIGGNGPRSTPTIHRGRVYVFGSQGDLRALNLADGELIWHRRLRDDYGVKVPEWGFTSSPLIVPGETPEQDLVVVSLGDPNAPSPGEGGETAEKSPEAGESEAGNTDGKSLVALRADDGSDVWAGGEDRVGYSSADLRTLAGVPQILIFNGSSVASHDPADGRVLWTLDWPGDHPHVAQPLVLGEDRFIVSSGYGNGAKLFKPTVTTAEDGTQSWEIEEIWDSRRLKAKFAGFVEHGGKIYGLDDGIMTCVDPATGDRCWKKGRYGHGQILLVDDLILVQTEKGELKLLEADPDGLVELGSIQALEGKSWNTLTLSKNRLLLRNADEAVCYELPLAG